MNRLFSHVEEHLSKGLWTFEKGFKRAAEMALPIGRDTRREWLDSLNAFIAQQAHGSRWGLRGVAPILEAIGKVESQMGLGDSRLIGTAEIRNRLHVFRLFEQAPQLAGCGTRRAFDLPPAVEKIYRQFAPGDSVWIIEGLGYAFAERNWYGQIRGHGALLAEVESLLPPKALIPLHVGMGLSLAERQVINRSEGLAGGVRKFLTLCDRHSVPGYDMAAKEALGLAVKTLAPSIVDDVNEALQVNSPMVRALFWHGIGRGSYFTPLSVLACPNGDRRQIEEYEEISPDDLALDNVIAGAAWARLLVNLENARLFLDYLDLVDERLGLSYAFQHGVSAAAVIWRDCAPEDSRLEQFLNFSPGEKGAASMTKWEAAVRSPALQSLAYAYPYLKERGQLTAIFAVARFMGSVD